MTSPIEIPKNLERYVYFREQAGVLFCGDCREILPYLPKVDLVLTDPPYGIDYQSARRIDWQRKEKIEGDTEFPVWIFNALQPDKALFVWCRWDILNILPTPKSLIVWDKQRHSMGDLSHEYGRQWEACAFYPMENHQFITRPKDFISYPCIPAYNLLHPNEKPVPVLTQIICQNVGDLILDPFTGSGSTLLAAKKLNRFYIGIELKEKYCQIAKRRLSQEVMNFEERKDVTLDKQAGLL